MIEDMIATIGPESTAAVVRVPPTGVKASLVPLTFPLENKKLIGVKKKDLTPRCLSRLKSVQLHGEGKVPHIKAALGLIRQRATSMLSTT